jgi:hypothetical protein
MLGADEGSGDCVKLSRYRAMGKVQGGKEHD